MNYCGGMVQMAWMDRDGLCESGVWPKGIQASYQLRPSSVEWCRIEA